MRLERFIGVLEGLRISGVMVRVSTQYACEKPADYRAKLGDAHEIEVTGLDSVTTWAHGYHVLQGTHGIGVSGSSERFARRMFLVQK
jgi:hypothetical protein